MTAHLAALAEPGSAITVDWSFQQYLSASDFVSRSALEDLRQRGPAYYHAKHIARTIQDSDSAAMELGRHVHMRLLEPEEWERRVMVWEPLPRPAGAYGREKAGTDARHYYDIWKTNAAQWEARRNRHSANGGIVISPAQAAQVEAMSASARSHPICEWAFRSSGANEQTILWHHPDTGILIRCRLDRLLWYDNRTAVVADVKTTTDPSPEAFGRSIWRYGYHRQAAMYVDAVRALVPGAEVHYELIAIRSTPPYETACYSLEEEPGVEDGSPTKGPIELGREQYTAALHELAQRRADDDWLAEWQRQSVPINIPAFAYRTPA